MAGGHASSRVDSGSMKFRPGVSIRRPRPVDPPSTALTSQAAGPSIIPIPTSRPAPRESDSRAKPNSRDDTDVAASTESASPEHLSVTDPSGLVLTPPPTQIQPPLQRPDYSNAISIQPGLSRTINTMGIQTPPATQLSTANFPVDPAILEFTNLSQEDEPLPPGIPQLVVEPAREPDLAPVTLGVDQMPPPPPLPNETEPQSNHPDTEDTAVVATPTSSKRGRRASAKEPKPRKRRKTAKVQDTAAEGQENNAKVEQSEVKPRRKRSSQKKGRKPMTMEEKIEALEQEAAKAAEDEDVEPLDPTTATMASLCDFDITTGRLSSKYLEKGIAYVKHVEERRQRIMERTSERLRKLRQSGLDVDQPPVPPAKKPEPTPAPPGTEVDEDGDPIAGPSARRELGASLSPSPEREPGPPEETFIESAAAPQIRFVNGEMVLDEESQFYDRAGAAAQDEDSMVVVDEADSTRFSNSNSFMKKAGSRGSRWTADETELFYWCLSAFGEDYENIARYLGRTPLQCKNKTKSEDRRGNEKRITLAIKTRIPLDLEEFGRITGRDFSGPPPEIRAPVAPPRAENEEQEPVPSAVKAKAASTTPSTTPRKNRKASSPSEEEIMTLEEYERDGQDD
ncbi:hypothetical protein ACGC1H_006823 [Rhizoctonia solani]|uniref:SANT domain-containing protein n=1 Tax=Rhizoctonia solani TaxID=456999 RepID=A0A8H3B3W5_9AGAM|nr:unnamed protein product [Rhizoctonia solani]